MAIPEVASSEQLQSTQTPNVEYLTEIYWVLKYFRDKGEFENVDIIFNLLQTFNKLTEIQKHSNSIQPLPVSHLFFKDDGSYLTVNNSEREHTYDSGIAKQICICIPDLDAAVAKQVHLLSRHRITFEGLNVHHKDGFLRILQHNADSLSYTTFLDISGLRAENNFQYTNEYAEAKEEALYGGDLLLKNVSAVMLYTLQHIQKIFDLKTVELGRIGGDEFGIIFVAHTELSQEKKHIIGYLLRRAVRCIKRLYVPTNEDEYEILGIDTQVDFKPDASWYIQNGNITSNLPLKTLTDNTKVLYPSIHQLSENDTQLLTYNSDPKWAVIPTPGEEPERLINFRNACIQEIQTIRESRCDPRYYFIKTYESISNPSLFTHFDGPEHRLNATQDQFEKRSTFTAHLISIPSFKIPNDTCYTLGELVLKKVRYTLLELLISELRLDVRKIRVGWSGQKIIITHTENEDHTIAKAVHSCVHMLNNRYMAPLSIEEKISTPYLHVTLPYINCGGEFYIHSKQESPNPEIQTALLQGEENVIYPTEGDEQYVSLPTLLVWLESLADNQFLDQILVCSTSKRLHALKHFSNIKRKKDRIAVLKQLQFSRLFNICEQIVGTYSRSQASPFITDTMLHMFYEYIDILRKLFLKQDANISELITFSKKSADQIAHCNISTHKHHFERKITIHTESFEHPQNIINVIHGLIYTLETIVELEKLIGEQIFSNQTHDPCTFEILGSMMNIVEYVDMYCL